MELSNRELNNIFGGCFFIISRIIYRVAMAFRYNFRR